MSVLPEMPCQEFVERVTDYLEDALVPADRARLEQHLADCSHCAEYLSQLRLVIDAGKTIAVDDLTPSMREDLIEVFSRWQHEGHEHPGEGST